MKLTKILGGLSLALFWATVQTHAAHCIDDRNFYQNLPTVIGKEDQVGKFPFALKCDTVFVRKGVTTIIYPGTLLYFALPSIENVIKVEGTLLIKGSKNSHVILSGSLDSTRNGIEPGNRPWGGIEVAKGGRLEVDFGGFMRAPTPIMSFSPEVLLVNAWFKGGLSIIFPDGSDLKLEKDWHAINKLNMAEGMAITPVTERPADAISDREKAALLNKSKPGFWNWKTMTGGAATLAVLGIGASIILSPEEKKSNPEPNPKPNPKDPSSTLDDFKLGLPTDEN